VGAAIANLTRARGIANYFREICAEKRNGRTLADWVRAARDQSRPTISTSHNEGCGGYASGYIYRIEYAGLQPYDLDERIMPPGAAITWASDGLRVYMDQPTLAQASAIVVDLRLGTEEWAFFTKVPGPRITAYKTSSTTFQTMSTVPITSRRLW
jgi:hypothetical protein